MRELKMSGFTSAIAGALTMAAAALLPAAAMAANFMIEKTEKYGVWSATLYRNINGNRMFCALEANDGKTDFRINRYKDSGDTFLEFYNPDWTMMQGEVRFELHFEAGTDKLGAEFRGKSWGDSYTYDFTDTRVYQTLLDLIAGSDTLTAFNSNRAVIARFDGRGARKAVMAYNVCVDE